MGFRVSFGEALDPLESIFLEGSGMTSQNAEVTGPLPGWMNVRACHRYRRSGTRTTLTSLNLDAPSHAGVDSRGDHQKDLRRHGKAGRTSLTHVSPLDSMN